MPEFRTNQTIAVEDPKVEVDVAASELGVGRHRFNLTVTDDSGNVSAPAEIEVIIRDDKRPTAVLDVVDEDGRRISPVVSPGENFILSGARSVDQPPGTIIAYRFTLLDDL